MNLLKKIFAPFYRLSVRIFFVFWINSILLVSLAIFIPYMDQRQVQHVTKQENKIVVERLDQMVASKRHHRMMKNRMLIIPMDDLDKKSSAINDIENDQYQHFVSDTIDQKKPRQQNINDRQISGPYFSKLSTDAYYFFNHKPPQSYYLTRLFDSPFILISLMMLISIPFVALLSWSLYKPMKHLKMAAERVAKGDWEIDKNLEKGTIEFKTLGTSFNNMVEALINAEAEKDRLFANLSHELRTPLTRIRLTNSLIRRKTDQFESEVSRIESNLIFVEERIQSMLSLSRQLILSRDQLENISLNEALSNLLAEAKFEAEANNKALVYSNIPDQEIQLNIDLFQSGLENILRNAIHYAASKIDVMISLLGNTLTITISDDGCGVKKEDLAHMFEAFYRGEHPDNIPDSNGAGLGLAIAEQMTKTHKGTIVARNNEPHGLVITLTFPLTQA